MNRPHTLRRHALRAVAPLTAVLALAAAARAEPAPAGHNVFSDVIAAARSRCVKIYGATIGISVGYGTGIIVSPEGHILTAMSIMLADERIDVITADGTRYRATFLRRDDALQAALLKIDAETPQYFELPETSPVQSGDWIIAVHNGFRVADRMEALSANAGIVSARIPFYGKRFRRDIPYEGEVLVVDAITGVFGGAGGAAVTLDGKLCGMIGPVITGATTRTRLNYLVPAERLRSLMQDPGDGAAGSTADPPAAGKAEAGFKLFMIGGKRSPPYVDRIRPGSPASAAGLRKDDLILSINGQSVRTCQDFLDAFERLAPGDKVNLAVKRRARIVNLDFEATAAKP